MGRNRRFWVLGVICAGWATVLAGVGPARGADREHPTTAVLLPDSTAVLLWVPDAPDAMRRFQNMGLGRILRDPQMGGLVDAVMASLSQTVAAKDLGVTLQELVTLPQGELALAWVAREDRGPALAVRIDAGNRVRHLQQLLDRISRGARGSPRRIRGTTVVIHEGAGPGEEPMAFFRKGGTVVVATDLDLLERILAAWDGDARGALATDRGFGEIMRRCREQNPKPQLAWYVNPVLLFRSVGQESASVRSGLEVFPRLGLDGLRAVGGGIEWDAGRLDSMAHAHFLLEGPARGIVKMLAFTSGSITPQSWVPADVSTYTTMHFDLPALVASGEELFDSFRGEGAFSDAVQRWLERPTGVDLRKDLLPILTGRVTHLTCLGKAGTDEVGSSALAWELRADAKWEPIVQKIAEAGEAFLVRRSFGGRAYFEFTLPGWAQGLAGGLPDGASLPKPCFGVLDRDWILTDRASLYEKMVATAEGLSDRLAESPSFSLVAEEVRRRSRRAKPVLIRFRHSEVALRWMYDMATADATRRMLQRQADRNMFSRALSAGLEHHTLPPFSAIAPHLGPGGGMVTVDAQGIHYTGFTLRGNP